MKTSWPLMTLALSAAMMAPVRGGTLTYIAIPAQNSDTQAGLRSDTIYTSAVDGGSVQDADRIINGVALHPLKGAGNTAVADHVTISVASGALANTKLDAPLTSADGLMGAALSDAIANEQADDNSEQYIVLDPSSLKAGQTYDVRVYVAPLGQQSRSVNLSFLGDGKEPISTEFFNEDDATTVPGNFTAPTQAYYINYRYTWDGRTTPGFTVTQKSGKNPFLLFALTNQWATADTAPAPVQVADASATAETPQASEPADTIAPPQDTTEVAVTGDPAPPETVVADSLEREPAPTPVTAPPAPTLEHEATTTQSEPAPVVVSSSQAASVETFYADQTLTRNGRWVEVEGYGRCWQPQGVATAWKPYTVGAWQYSTEVGWAWTSPEPWALATYHYGRWILLNGSGWCWVPGVQWAPAWCAWRYGHGFVGWAPLPPEADLAQSGVIGASVEATCHIGPKFYSFCRTEELGAEDLSSVVVSEDQVVTLMAQTRNVTSLGLRQGVVFCGGPKYEVIHEILKKSHHPEIALVSAGKLVGPNLKVDLHPKHLPNVAARYKLVQIDRGWNVARSPKIVSTPVRHLGEDKVRIEKPRRVEHGDVVTKNEAAKRIEGRDRVIEKKVTHQVVEHPKVIEERVKPLVVTAPQQEVVVKRFHPTAEKTYVAHYVKRDDRFITQEEWRGRKVALYAPRPITYSHNYHFAEHRHWHGGHEDLYVLDHSRFDDRPHRY